jgi:cytoskeletal protein RodZ
MAIKSKTKKTKIEIDLTGPQGNAFYLLGCVKPYAKQLGLDAKVIEEEMKSSDYDHLIKTFDKYFGDYVDLII